MKVPSPRLLTATQLSVAVLLCLIVTTLGCSGEQPVDSFRVSVARDGVYAVSFEALQSAGLNGSRESARLGMSVDGEPVPIWVDDGGDGEFGPGDHMEFLGQHASGERSYFSEHDIYNQYRLTVASPEAVPPARFIEAVLGDVEDGQRLRSTTTINRHLEEDKLLVRFAARPDGDNPEPWYWARLTQLDKPWTTKVRFQELAKDAGPVSIRVGLRGWSQQRRRGVSQTDQRDHLVEVRLNGKTIGSGEWDGQEEHVIEIADLGDLIESGNNTVSLKVPRRTVAGTDDQLVDAVLLNWIELSYERTTTFRAEGFAGSIEKGPLLARATKASKGVAFAGGQRLDLAEMGEAKRWAWDIKRGDVTYAPVLFEPEAIVADRSSNLKATDQQADYLMVAPQHLQAEVEPLAEFHRERGLTTKIVDIDDIFDEFSHGQTHPDALRDFVAHAYHEWEEPKPRFVLLVGDASWDVRNLKGQDQRYADWTYRSTEGRQFAKNASTNYSKELRGRNRNLIPTWRFHTFEGQAASDNHFVTVDGDDYMPDLAIGRFPVTEPEEVRAIVQKTIRYVDQPEVGPWRRNVLWVTNENRGYQRNNERFAKTLGEQGYGALRVYPSSEEKDNSQHQQSLIDAFDQGVSVVNFIGHGGRYIWRTGPPDPAKNHDLFTLDHLDQLQPTEKLPVVVSLTCYSAPFDHPTADSIGEKFLRLGDRGAIGVFAASWRNSPSARFSSSLMTSLVDPRFTSIGEALTYGKSQVRSPVIVHTYNYFGDPAAPLVRPTGAVDIEYAPGTDQLLVQLHQVAPIDEESPALAGPDAATRNRRAELHTPLAVELGDPVKLDARAIVEWVGEQGEILREVEIDLADGAGTVSCEGGCEGAGSVRAYAWSQRKQWDAVGNLTLATRATTL